MTSRRKTMAWVLAGISTLLVALAVICSDGIPMGWRVAMHRSQRLRGRLLCKTDHEALLEGGRGILRQVPMPDTAFKGGILMGSVALPDGLHIPKVIRDLAASDITVNYEGYLNIEMHGGMDHFGVRVYPKDYSEPYSNYTYGDKELLPGLWYYDDGYRRNPRYAREIDALINRARGHQ